MKKTRNLFGLLALSTCLAITSPVLSQGTEAATENSAESNDDDDEGKWGLAGLLGLLGLLGLRKRGDDNHHTTHTNR